MNQHRPGPDEVPIWMWIARIGLWLIGLAVITIFIALTVERLLS
ncbi:hypothetical protein [Kribbella sp. HUAS MG21]|uniref:DUF2474 domain-containing protein n=1 Tax=Kribbella sp. HUAS MG21 TaxID=3160966 RepID=A0AAU7T7W0_9ACTN